MSPCLNTDGQPADRPTVWSRRNGPWRNSDVLWVGAAPGNDGGRGAGTLGAHGTRIPFGGDIAGANLDVMLGNVGLTRNDTFIVAALNQLPARGGGEPSRAEVLAPQGDFRNGIELLRDTLVAVAPRLIVALGNIAARAVASAWLLEPEIGRLASLNAVRRAGWERNLPARLSELGAPSSGLLEAWTREYRSDPEPVAVWITHPSAQNMSPHAGVDTVFHARMLESLDVLRDTVRRYLGWTPPEVRPEPPEKGVYALAEWRDRIRGRTEALDRLWREKGV